MVYWKPSMLVIVVSLIAWVGLTGWLTESSLGTRAAVYGLSGHSASGEAYEFEVSVSAFGYGPGSGFNVLKRSCEVTCRRVHMPSHEIDSELLQAARFMGDRRVLLRGEKPQQIVVINWGHKDDPAPNLWDPSGRYLCLDDRNNYWGPIEPGIETHSVVLFGLIVRSAAFMLLPIAFVWLVIYVTMSIVVHDRQRHHWRCPECGYDLRGLATPGCPECGWNRG